MHHVAIFGGGPAGLIAADRLAEDHVVHLFEQEKTLGRKFLVAGDGGLNITNAAEHDELLGQYTPAGRMRDALLSFGPLELRAWLQELGIPTFIGTSGRVFPAHGIKPAEVLKAIVDRLKRREIIIRTGHRFMGFDPQARPVVEHAGERMVVEAGRYVFALGGASWPKTGSTGDWSSHFEAIGVSTVPFRASNCGVATEVPGKLRLHAGKPLKNIALTCGDRTVRGEATITAYGLEGNAVYPLVPQVREALAAKGHAVLVLDLKPDLTIEQMEMRLRDAAWKERMAALRLDRPAVALLKACCPVDRYLDGRTLAHDVKHVQVIVHGLRPIDEAISTVGGIALDEVNGDLSLVRHPHLFVAGEMLDWDAPTGGFLLQGAFSLGRWAAEGVVRSWEGSIHPNN